MPWRRLSIYLLMAGGFFAAMGPTLSWLEFSGGLENLNIATALELRRDHPGGLGNWLIPTLEGEARVKKPPLTAWITAAAIRPSTLAALSSPDPQQRNGAALRLAWEARWPALLAACLMIIAACELGRILADEPTGYLAGIVLGTTLMFTRFARSAMIDVHMGLWVTLASIGLALALLRGRRWSGCLLAGAALGLAFLCKGPVAWVQTLVPAIVFVALVWWRRWDSGALPARGGWILPIIASLIVFCAIALPWYIHVAGAFPEGWRIWTDEATAERGEKPDKPWAYLALIVYLLPWTVSFIGGIISARRGIIFAVCLTIVPLLLMTLYKDRKERYIFPVSGAAAVVAAHGVMTLARKRGPWNGLDRAAVAQHWIILVIIGIGFPALAATQLHRFIPTMTGEPWLSRGWGAGLTIVLGLVIAAGLLFRRRWMQAMTAATIIVMLAVSAAGMHGYAMTEAGRSPMRPLADAIWAACPDARMLNAHPREKRASVDLSIYLNRPTRWISTQALEKLQPGDRPHVVVMLQDPEDANPTPPTGWEPIGKTKRKKDYWWAFALPAR